MKKVLFLSIWAFAALLASCGNTEETTTETATDQVPTVNMPEGMADPAAAAAPAAGGDVPHYICPKGCAGGGGPAQGKCLVCGSELSHNAAFHAAPGGESTGATPPPAPTAEPAQNAKGVWHYTCAKGCAGGSGNKGDKCAGCGAELAHNPVYHQ